MDADQAVILTGRRYDVLLGHAGAEGDLYPALSDEPTRAEMDARLNLDVPGEAAWPTRQEATETAWLLGAPFFVQVIEGGGDTVAHVLAGAADASAAGRRLLDARWRQTVARPADVVVAALGGDPARHTFADLAAAASRAARVVQPNGRIVLLSQARPDLGPSAEVLLGAGDPDRAFKQLWKQQTLAFVPAIQWAFAARQARLYLLSGLPEETVEDLFATPLRQGGQVQRLLDAGGSCLFLADAHKALPILATESGG